MVVADGHIIAHELAKRTFGPPHGWQDAAFDDDFGVDRNVKVNRSAASQIEWRAGDLAGDLHLVLVVAEWRGGGEHQADRRSEQDRSFERFAARLGLRLVLRLDDASVRAGLATLVVDDLAAVERQIWNACPQARAPEKRQPSGTGRRRARNR